MMSMFWTLIFVLALSCSQSKAVKKLPSVFVVGSVNCDTSYSKQDLPKSTHSIAGASVAVECINNSNSSRSFRKETKTDKNGEFKVNLPFHGSKSVIKRINGCSVKLLSSNEPSCAVAASPSSSPLILKESKEETHIFSTVLFTFNPLKRGDDAQTKSPIFNPEKPIFLPPLPQLPRLPTLPSLPRLPPFPRIPFLPSVNVREMTAAEKLTSNDDQVNHPTMFPFLPNPTQPPGLFPPIPFLQPPFLFPPVVPSPPSSIFPPGFPFPPFFPSPRPSRPPATSLPQIPGLCTPPPPVLPFPFQSFPFLPKPGFPGVPAAVVSNAP